MRDAAPMQSVRFTLRAIEDRPGSVVLTDLDPLTDAALTAAAGTLDLTTLDAAALSRAARRARRDLPARSGRRASDALAAAMVARVIELLPQGTKAPARNATIAAALRACGLAAGRANLLRLVALAQAQSRRRRVEGRARMGAWSAMVGDLTDG